MVLYNPIKKLNRVTAMDNGHYYSYSTLYPATGECILFTIKGQIDNIIFKDKIKVLNT
jgi:hypothetical protein